MMEGLIRVGSGSGVDDVVEILERDGAVVVEDFVDDISLKRLWDDLGPALEACAFGDGGYVGKRTRRVSSLFGRTAHLTPVVTQPLFLGAARQILQKPVHIWIGRSRIELAPSIQIRVTQAIQLHK